MFFCPSRAFVETKQKTNNESDLTSNQPREFYIGIFFVDFEMSQKSELCPRRQGCMCPELETWLCTPEKLLVEGSGHGALWQVSRELSGCKL